MMPPAMLAMIEPITAPNQLTSTPGTSHAPSANRPALITTANNPNVRQEIGSERNETIGLMNELMTPITMPNSSTLSAVSNEKNRSEMVAVASAATTAASA